jgi:hypothetical protein
MVLRSRDDACVGVAAISLIDVRVSTSILAWISQRYKVSHDQYLFIIFNGLRRWMIRLETVLTFI